MNQSEKFIGILGIGTYVPEKIMTNLDFEKIVDTSDEWITTRTGIKERRIASAEEATSDLATKAALKALENAKTSPDEIDLIIVNTATPDMLFPSSACLVQENIKAKNAAAFDLSAGCTGFVYGLVTGVQFIKTGLYKKVLVIGADALSKIVDFTDRNTCVLFGDGAGAVVLGETEQGYGILGADLNSDGSGGEYLKIAGGGSRNPATIETLNNKLHYLYMNGPEVFKFAVKAMGDTSLRALKKSNLTVNDVSWFIPHQANTRIISAAAKRLKIPMEQVVINLDKYGNTSAATIPLALEEALNDGKIKNDDILVFVGFGAGLTWGACVVKWRSLC
ncbi:ketoacyl-ACP synthase III [Selenomonadales bacterium OttesenSCG-928-I06]|nr:ketoacyl-ACP synthase III [Selenomonadales bacterium OttesenSCG-928-I06]